MRRRPTHCRIIDDVEAETSVSERTHQIEELDPEPSHSTPGVRMTSEGGVFAWRGDEVVLLAEHTAGGYVLARGWAYGDRLVDIRRWSFPTPPMLAGQVRRLAREATGNQRIAAVAAAAALTWAHAQVAAEPDPRTP